MMPYPSRADAQRTLAEMESEAGDLARQIDNLRTWLASTDPYAEHEPDPLLRDPSPVTAERDPDRTAA